MQTTSIFELGEKLQVSGRLTSRPLCVYTSKKVPLGAIAAPIFDRCIIGGLFHLAVSPAINSIYLDSESSKGLCPGGQGWLGYRPISPGIKYFVSTGKPDRSTTTAEYLLDSPEGVESIIRQGGKITAVPDYLFVTPCELLQDENVHAMSIILFGNAETIRNFAALAHFRATNIFHRVVMPFGAACATLITYAAGILEHAPKDTVFVGPTDPTHNYIIPPDYLAMAIPIQIAHQMATDLEFSFINKHPSVAFPTGCEALNKK